jgi:hypothetical protein
MKIALIVLALAMQQYTHWPSCSVGDAHTAPATEEGCKKVGGTFHPGSVAYKDNGGDIGDLWPMDVPAVYVNEIVLTAWWSKSAWAGLDSSNADRYAQECLSLGGMWHEGDHKAECHKQRWTCKDKARILLTSEDGKKHCVRFSK